MCIHVFDTYAPKYGTHTMHARPPTRALTVSPDSESTMIALEPISHAVLTADDAAEARGLPPIDSLDVWPLVSAENTSSPRTEILLTPLSGDRYNGTNLRSGDAALIVGTHKLIVGHISQARPGPSITHTHTPHARGKPQA